MSILNIETAKTVRPDEESVLTYVSTPTDKWPDRLIVLSASGDSGRTGRLAVSRSLSAILDSFYQSPRLQSVSSSLIEALVRANERVRTAYKSRGTNQGVMSAVLAVRRGNIRWATAGPVGIAFLPFKKGRGKKKANEDPVVTEPVDLSKRSASVNLGMSTKVAPQSGRIELKHPGLLLVFTPGLEATIRGLQPGFRIEPEMLSRFVNELVPSKGPEDGGGPQVILAAYCLSEARKKAKARKLRVPLRRMRLDREPGEGIKPLALVPVLAALLVGLWFGYNRYLKPIITPHQARTAEETTRTMMAESIPPSMPEQEGVEREQRPLISALDSLWHIDTEDPITSTATISDSLIFFGSRDRNLYAVEAATGLLKWKYPTGGGIGSSPAVSENRVVFGSYDKFIYVVDANSGNLAWRYRTGDDIRASPTVASGLVLIGSNDRNLWAIDLATGKPVWRFPTRNRVWSTPTVSKGRVYFGSVDANIYAISLDTGEFIWSYRTNGPVYSGPKITDDLIYFGSRDGAVYAIDREKGQVVWTQPTGGPIHGSPCLFDDLVIIGSNDKSVYGLDARSGEIKWRATCHGDLLGSPVAFEGSILIGCYDHNLYVIDASDGTITHRYPVQDRIYATPLVWQDQIYFGDFSGRFYGLRAVLEETP